MRVTADLERATGRRIPLTAFFETPTVEGLALLLQDDAPAAQLAVAAADPDRRGRGRHSSGCTDRRAIPLLPRYLHPEQPLYGLMHQAHDGGRAQHTSVPTKTSIVLESRSKS